MIRRYLLTTLMLSLPAMIALAQTSNKQQIDIGIAAPMTGPIAHLGKDIDAGARLAFSEVNKQGLVIGGKQVTFNVITVDDQSDPKTATQVANNLVDKKVVAVIGHYNSGTTIPASRIYAAHGIPQITPGATNPVYTHQGLKTAFRIIANDTQQSQALASFAYGTLKAKRIAVIDDRTTAGQGQADMFVAGFKKLGGTVIAREYTSASATDFMAILTKIKAKNPDLIYYGGMDSQAGPMAKQLKSLNMQTKLLGADGMQSTVFTDLAGKDAVGHMASSIGLPRSKMPNFVQFDAKFTSVYGDMQAYAPYSYDAAMVIVEAMKQADSTNPAVFVNKIRAINYSGVTGNISFDKNGDIKDGVITIYQVNAAGKWESYTP